ncbi:MAG: single-stranded-DNA-specific exonuclease RecJ [Pleurocapsa minor GSE-CHR-MK-17-07R]|jgi:single-stranded-DNA-specific exonuclease|nr:single-stranded-DNA-specific exonuclease RecJ [Pleurocapsa minor GSE-CHR-MK 17-07R]
MQLQKLKWEKAAQPAIPPTLEALGLHPIAARRLTALGITTADEAEAFLNPDAYLPADPFELPDMEGAVERLWRALKFEEKVLIWGDFDADGQTATALLKTGLTDLGFMVQTHVPKREGEGHGMFMPKVKEWLSRGVQLIVTCDTGISAHEAVALANEHGVDVIITDHHELGESLPDALAVVSTMRLPDGHPLRDLPGVGIAWKLIEALGGENMTELAGLAALGIIGDVALLRKDTRYLAQVGINALRVTTNPGLSALIERANINPLTLSDSDIGFSLVPRLNAQGRLGDAAASVELLTTDDPARAAELANQLEGLNERRKVDTDQIERAALEMIEKDPSLNERYAVLVLSHPAWTGGIIGIVANRLAEKYRKPVVLLREADGKFAGSARSVYGVHITDALKQLPAGMLASFGGHTMAAGMRLADGVEVAEFRRELSVLARKVQGGKDITPSLTYDGELTLDQISLSLAEDLNRLAPFGNGNRPFAFIIRDLHVKSRRHLDRKKEHLELIVSDTAEHVARVLWWGAGDAALPDGTFDLACTLRVNHYKGVTEPVLEYLDWTLHPGVTVKPFGTSPLPAFAVIDWRGKPEKPKLLLEEARRAYSSAQIWSEGVPAEGSVRREQLKPNKTLIVFCEPADATTWRAVLERADPARVIFIQRRLPPPTANEIIAALVKLCTRISQTEARRIPLETLASLCYTSIAVIKEGLNVMSGMGYPFGVRVAADVAHVTPDAPGTPHITSMDTLGTLLAEVEAYRAWWRRREWSKRSAEQ